MDGGDRADVALERWERLQRRKSPSDAIACVDSIASIWKGRYQYVQ